MYIQQDPSQSKRNARISPLPRLVSPFGARPDSHFFAILPSIVIAIVVLIVVETSANLSCTPVLSTGVAVVIAVRLATTWTSIKGHWVFGRIVLAPKMQKHTDQLWVGQNVTGNWQKGFKKKRKKTHQHAHQTPVQSFGGNGWKIKRCQALNVDWMCQGPFACADTAQWPI